MAAQKKAKSAKGVGNVYGAIGEEVTRQRRAKTVAFMRHTLAEEPLPENFKVGGEGDAEPAKNSCGCDNICHCGGVNAVA
jgi:hypothetical protein